MSRSNSCPNHFFYFFCFPGVIIWHQPKLHAGFFGEIPQNLEATSAALFDPPKNGSHTKMCFRYDRSLAPYCEGISDTPSSKSLPSKHQLAFTCRLGLLGIRGRHRGIWCRSLGSFVSAVFKLQGEVGSVSSTSQSFQGFMEVKKRIP